VAFRLAREIPREFVDGLEDHVARVPTEAGLGLIEHARQLLLADGDRAGAANVSLARVSFLAHQGKTDAAMRAFDEVQRGWGLRHDVTQVVRVRNYLREEKGVVLPVPAAIRLACFRQRLAGAWRRRLSRGGR
jgi:hypothetical protein